MIELLEALLSGPWLVAEAGELGRVEAAHFAQALHVDVVGLVLPQRVGRRLQAGSQQRVEHVDFGASLVQAFGPGEVIHAGGFDEHDGVGQPGVVFGEDFFELLPARLVGRERAAPALRAIGTIELRDRGVLRNVQSQNMVLCHGRWWVEDGPRGLGLWPGETIPFSGGKNTREPRNDSRRRSLRQTEVALRSLHLNTRRERQRKPKTRRLPLTPRVRPPSWRALRCAEPPRAPLGLNRTRFMRVLTQACLQAISLHGDGRLPESPASRLLPTGSLSAP